MCLERVDKVDTLQAESSLSELSFENKDFRSRGAHRASPCKERFLRYTPAKTAFFTSEGISPLTTPQILEFSVFRQSEQTAAFSVLRSVFLYLREVLCQKRKVLHIFHILH